MKEEVIKMPEREDYVNKTDGIYAYAIALEEYINELTKE